MTARSRQWSRAVWVAAAAVVVVEVAANIAAVVLTGRAGAENALTDVIGSAGAEMFSYMQFEMHVDALIFISAAVVGAVILSRYPRQGFGWALGVGWGVVLMSLHVSMVGAGFAAEAANDAGSAWFMWLQSTAESVAFIAIPFALILYPTGRSIGPWWRRVLGGFLTFGSVLVVGYALRSGPMRTSTGSTTLDNPIGLWQWPADQVFEFFDVAFIVFMLASAITRFVRARGVERQQMKWVFTIGGFATIMLTVSGFFESAYPDTAALLSIVSGALGALGVLAIGMAILRYRLYDIDLVISRSIVFGLLAGFITAVYAVVVGTLGSLIGGSDVVLAIAATTIVAVAFEPVRERVQRLANRMVYGRRAAPYEVLSDLARSLPNAESEAGLLTRMASQLRAGTGAERAQVWLTNDAQGLDLAASDPIAPDASVDSIETLDGVVILIEHDAETLGALTAETSPGTPLRPAELRLAHDLAGSAALVLTKLRLDTDLERTAAELGFSRRRVVDAQNTELRRLERRLQEGAIQDILGLKLAIALAERTARAEGTTRTADLLATLANETQGAIDEIHSLATGLYPAVLESEGLDSAIRAMASTAPVTVTVTGTVDPLPPADELAAYYCVSEAITNAMKHGEPPIRVALSDRGTAVDFAITDAGPGFDTAAVSSGSGLLNMRDRLDSIGGTLEIKSAFGSSTTVTGSIPRVGATPARQSIATASESGPNSDLDTNATAPASSAGAS